MRCNNTYKSICNYNDNRLLVTWPDIACKSYSVYDSYNRQVYGCADRYPCDCLTKGQVRFVYTPESDSCYQNRRCC